MNLYNFAPIRALLTGAHWLITNLTDLLAPAAGASAAALAIVLLTLGVRALLIPVGISQAKAQAARARLAPQIENIKKKYKNNPERLQKEMLAVYSDNGASPVAGCLPMLAQMPILMAVYGLFIQPTINGQPNTLLTYALAGVPLDTSLGALVLGGGATWVTGGVFAGVIAVIIAVAALTRSRLTPEMPEGAPLGKALGYLPFMTAIIAVIVPLAAGLYLATTTAWTLAERLVLKRRFPTEP